MTSILPVLRTVVPAGTKGRKEEHSRETRTLGPIPSPPPARNTTKKRARVAHGMDDTCDKALNRAPRAQASRIRIRRIRLRQARIIWRCDAMQSKQADSAHVRANLGFYYYYFRFLFP